MNKRPLSVFVTLILVVLNAFVWVVFGLIIAFNTHPSLPDIPIILWGMAIISFVIAATMVWLVYMLNNRYRIGYYCALALFITITFLTFLDQVGWSDLVILAINIAPIVLLIKERSWYLQNESAKQ